MIAEILEKINEAETIIIHRHIRPDPDAIGSQAGLASLIQHRYPEKKVFMVGEEEESLHFLARMDDVEDKLFADALIIVCDTANEERISDERYRNGRYVIKIDHHPNEEPFGDLLWIDPSASSTSEMIYELFLRAKERFNWSLSQEAAFRLYAGIVGDTGRFRYPNTTEKTHRYTADLVATGGIDQTAFYSALYRKDLRLARLEGYILQHVELTESGLGAVRLTKDLLDEFQVTTSESSALVNCFADIEGLLAWVFFVEENEGLIRVRLRSKGPIINKIAQKFGGGGHPLASGARADNWQQVEEIIADLEEACARFKDHKQ